MRVPDRRWLNINLGLNLSPNLVHINNAFQPAETNCFLGPRGWVAFSIDLSRDAGGQTNTIPANMSRPRKHDLGRPELERKRGNPGK